LGRDFANFFFAGCAEGSFEALMFRVFPFFEDVVGWDVPLQSAHNPRLMLKPLMGLRVLCQRRLKTDPGASAEN